jgi:NMD protein affecting ribosome stability and mRNA decay
MSENQTELCGKCGAEIDLNRRVDFTLKDRTRVCEQCFIHGNAKVVREIDSFYRH